MSATQTRTQWFLDARVRFLTSHGDGDDGISIIECDSETHAAPMHVHETEDEAFHVLEGALRAVVGGEELVLAPGEAAVAPKGVPHAIRVEGGRARWLVVTTNGDFEAFVRSQLKDELVPPDPDALAAAAAAHRIAIVGPPL